MSDLNLNISAAPDLQSAATGGTQTRTRPGAATPGSPDSPDNPFAALLSGVLQGTQPQTPAAGPVTPAPDPAGAAAEQSDSATGIPELLALPGIAVPLPAIPGTSTATGTATGNTLPVTGNPLSGLAAPPLAAAAPARAPEADAAAKSGTPAATDGNTRISLADLALSRPLEALSAAAAGTVTPAATTTLPTQAQAQVQVQVQALADQSVQQKGGRTEQAATAAQDATQTLPQLTATQGPGQTVTPLTAPIGADELAVRLGAANLQRGPMIPGAGSDALTGQLAAFAAGNDNSGSPNNAAVSSPAGGTDASNAALLGRPGGTTLPPLQPLAGNVSFAGGLADRLLNLGGPGTHTARLRLHPEHLGELNVEIQIDEGSAQVWFGTTTSQARAAIEASLPHLKELFADQGLALTRTQVDSGSGQTGQQSFDQQRQAAFGRSFEADRAWRNDTRTGLATLAALLPAARTSNRLVDAWA